MKILEETFTIQGEGRYTGVPSLFIRTTGCNLRCSWKGIDDEITVCDTPYSSLYPEKGYNLDIDNVLEKLNNSNTKHVIITGGEPSMVSNLSEIANKFIYNEYKVTVETNGTIYHKNMHEAFMSLSPKLKSSYHQEIAHWKNIHKRNNNFTESCKKWMETNDYQFKFVYSLENDLEEILQIQDKLKIPNDKIYLMPQGISTEQFKQVEKSLWNICSEKGFNFSQRVHINIFGNVRGI